MIEITWLGHGTYRMRLATGEVILVDPWVDGNPAYPAEHQIDRVDVMLITHGHFDHIHDAVPLAKKFSPLTGRPEQLAEPLHDLPGTQVWTLEPGVPVQW
jgi:L-ascorbate metabolism protein UlaG (beta-lactamase superfamily)